MYNNFMSLVCLGIGDIGCRLVNFCLTVTFGHDQYKPSLKFVEGSTNLLQNLHPSPGCDDDVHFYDLLHMTIVLQIYFRIKI